MEYFLPFYLAAASVIAVIITVYDKTAASARKRRIPEVLLLFSGFMGGAAAMYITMQIIRHKTRKLKFMILLPLFILLHLVLILYRNRIVLFVNDIFI